MNNHSLNRRAFLGLGSVTPLAVRVVSAGTFKPDRHWQVFVLNDSHLDIGWHALPDVIRDRIAGYVDDAVELCNATKARPESERYKFTIEHSWVVEYYEQHRKPEQLNRLLDCIRRRQIEVGAIYTSVHTDICGHEELVRLTALAGDLRRRFNLPITTAILNDVGESYTMGLAQVLARSGVSYFCLSPGAKADVKGIVPRIPRIFNWAAKDGSSVLVAWTPGIWTYARSSEAGYKGDETLREFQNLTDYPYNVIFRQGGKGDISSPDPHMHELIETYREESPRAQIQLSTAGEFFAALSSRSKSEIPAISGDVADSWADGVISLAHETSIHRRTQAELLHAEILMTLAGLDMRAQIREAYNNLQLYADHTWGFDFDPDNKPGQIRKYTRDLGGGKQKAVDVPAGETLGPGSPLMLEYEESWEAKKQYAYRAQRASSEVLDRSLRALNPQRGIAVWNTLSWPRSGPVRLRVPTGQKIRAVRERDSNSLIPVQRDVWQGDESFWFIANDVPAFGSKVYNIAEGTAEDPSGETGTNIDSVLYRIDFNPEAASIRSVFDKIRRRYVNDESAPYSLGQYIYDDVNDFYIGGGNGGRNKSGYAYGSGNRFVPEADGSPVVRRGPAFTSLTWHSKINSIPAAPRLQNRIVLWHGLPQVSVQCAVNKKATPRKEQVYLAFPFDVGGSPKFSLELAYTTLDWDKDIIPGSWRGYGCVRNYVRVLGQEAGVTWSSMDAPLACMGGINSNHWDPHWHDTYMPSTGHIYSYVMSNIWNCNYPLYQGGESQFEYSFVSHDQNFSKAESFRFGWEMHHPLEARLYEKPGDEDAHPTISCNVEPANVAVTVMKAPETGSGLVLRIYETDGRADTLASVHIKGETFSFARLVNLTEEELGPTVFRNGRLQVRLKPHELATIKLTR